MITTILIDLHLQVDFTLTKLVRLYAAKIINTIIAAEATVKKLLIMVLQQLQRSIETNAERDTTITTAITAIAIVITGYV